MNPTKSLLDYVSEINRLFPRSNENDIFLSPTRSSFLNQSMSRSSSSADTSPESFPDMIRYRFSAEKHQQSPAKPNQSPARPDHISRANQRLDFSNNSFDPFLSQPILHETPLVPRRERPIVGRKLGTDNLKPNKISNVWTEESRTPPSARINQVVYYELFPDGKGIQKNELSITTSSYVSQKPSNVCATATNMPSYASSISPWEETNMSSYASTMSPWMETMSEVSGVSTSPPSTFYPRSPDSSTSPRSSIPSRSSFTEPFMVPSTSLRTTGQTKMCTFCRKNGETPLVYTTHTLKEKIGYRNIVVCPILRSHVCSACGLSGDSAHTISYCPLLRSNNNGKPLQSTTVTLKNTRIKSDGRRRF